MMQMVKLFLEEMKRNNKLNKLVHFISAHTLVEAVWTTASHSIFINV